MRDRRPTYDIFVSYAHVDNRSGYVSRLVQDLDRQFHTVAGRAPRIFFDTGAIPTGQVWRDRILAALGRSTVMVAVLTPSYFNSPWCALEWDHFLEREKARVAHLLHYQRLIFGVLVRDPETLLGPSPDARRRIREAGARQYADFSSVAPDTPRFLQAVEQLAISIIEVLKELEQEPERSEPDAIERPDHQQTRNGGDMPSEEPGRAVAVQDRPITTSSGQDRAEFVRLLSEAVNLTIIGITHENLAAYLEEALAVKRKRHGERAFWESVRIVFLTDKLLHLVNDELVALHSDRATAAKERAQRAGFGKRTVMSFFLRANQPDKWTLHEYPYLLPFVGSLIGMGDGRTLVQVAPGRPRRSIEQHRFFQFLDGADRYYELAFQEIVNDSVEANEVVLVGSPINHGVEFRCRGARFRKGVMIEGANESDWLPAIVVVTWRRRYGNVEPLLQVNTRENSTREIGKVSHVSGYINQQDYLAQDDGPAQFEFDLPLSAAENAVRRELREELRIDIDSRPNLIKTLRFYYPDKENLFFYLFEVELSRGAQFPTKAEVHAWTVEELLRVREHQVLRNLAAVLGHEGLSPTQTEMAVRILALNLTLHGRRELGERLLAEVDRGNGALDAIRETVDELVERTRRARPSSGVELQLSGLAGLQYREFFSTLLPFYAGIGVPGATAQLDALRSDPAATAVVTRLEELYGEEAMMALPIEV